MRKTLIVSMMLIAGAGCFPMAGAGTPEVLKTSYFSIFPGKYTKDGKSFLFTYGREDDIINRITLYDENMQLIKVIEPVKLPTYESKYYAQRRVDGYEYVEPMGQEFMRDEVIEINGSTTGLSIEQVQSYIFDIYGVGEISTLTNGTSVVALYFFQQSSYGSKYPLEYYREIEGEWHLCVQEYGGSNWGPFGEWGEVTEETESIQSDVEDVGIIPDSGGDSEWYYVTNGIFGDGYHYLMPIYESKEFDSQEEYYGKPGWIYKKSWGTRYMMIGFTVYDSSNNEVTSIKLPAGYFGRCYVNFFQMGDNRYIGLEDVTDSEGEYYLVIYRIDSDNSVSFVTAAPSSKVSPRNPKRGEKVIVTFESAVGSDGAMVQVVSASGQTMLSKKIPAGQTQLDINTSGFSQGIYVVTVSCNGITKEAAKIIVR